MKEKTYNDYSSGNYANYQDFLRKDLKGLSIRYHKDIVADLGR